MNDATHVPLDDSETISLESALSPFKESGWLELSPRERLRRAWAQRSKLVDPQAVHDSKLFPAP
jgi:hypothetical protein